MNNLQAKIEAINELENKYKDFHKKYLINGYNETIEDRADKGCANAKYTLCQIKYCKNNFGEGWTRGTYNLAESSAKQGNAFAQCFLGNYCFEEGKVEEGFEWYMKSAKQGYIVAQIKVAECYYNGEGVEEDYNKAYEWLNISSRPQLDLTQNTLQNDNSTLILENRDLIETVKGLLQDKKKLINDNTKLINDIESKKEQSKLKNWFKKLKGKHNDK